MIKPDLTRSEEFLRLLYGDDASGYLAIWNKAEKKTLWILARDLESAAKQIADLSWVHFVIWTIDATTTSMSSPTLSPTPTKGGQKMPFKRANLALLMDYLGCPFWRLQYIDIKG
jgi:hypothetical protein